MSWQTQRLADPLPWLLDADTWPAIAQGPDSPDRRVQGRIEHRQGLEIGRDHSHATDVWSAKAFGARSHEGSRRTRSAKALAAARLFAPFVPLRAFVIQTCEPFVIAFVLQTPALQTLAMRYASRRQTGIVYSTNEEIEKCPFVC